MTILLGHPEARSRTRTVVLRFADLLRGALEGHGIELATTALVDLAELGPHLFAGPSSPDRAVVTGALATMSGARLLIVGSPTFKGTYTGLLKAFCDLLPRAGLPDTIAVPVMTAASQSRRFPAHAHLRTLLLDLNADVPVPGLCVLESEFGRSDPVLSAWIERSAPAVADALRSVPSNIHNGGQRCLGTVPQR
jgi:FMN reductase